MKCIPRQHFARSAIPKTKEGGGGGEDHPEIGCHRRSARPNRLVNNLHYFQVVSPHYIYDSVQIECHVRAQSASTMRVELIMQQDECTAALLRPTRRISVN